MSDFSISLSKVLVLVNWLGDLVLVIGPVTDIISGREAWNSQCNSGRPTLLCPEKGVFRSAVFNLFSSSFSSDMCRVRRQEVFPLRKSLDQLHCVSHHKVVSVDIT